MVDSASRKYSHARPLIHFTAPSWINDPCAPGYDQSTGIYHLFYQCNPYGCEWGNMSWGHAISTDLLNWTRRRDPALRPDQPYDTDGVFTGCMAPPDIKDDGILAVVYSSVRKLPFHWSTPPYPRNAAGVSLAISLDSGKTWEKLRENPVLLGEPDDIKVTGFRDPFIAKWPSADWLLGRAEEKLYGLVSGGVDTSGPTAFLYEVQPCDLTKWKYLGPLVDLPLNFQPSKNWSGNYGINWECVNFLSFQAGSIFKHFLLLGAEGDIERDHIETYDLPSCLSPRTVRSQLWMSGDLINNEGSIKLQYRQGGYLDHGSFYAANSFKDPMSGRYIVHGWIPEEDITPEHARQKGWKGSLALPREVFLLTIPAVVKALRSPLHDISGIETETRPDGAYDVYTLGVRPISEVDRFRNNCRKVHETNGHLLLPQSTQQRRRWLYSTISSTWELEATISLSSSCDTVGFYIRHNDDLSVSTAITFSSLAENITIDRAASNDAPNINRCAESGPFTLFTTMNYANDRRDEAELKPEALHLRILSDGDVLEVFANSRFALATMVYSNFKTGAHGGITAFATGEPNSAAFECVKIWDGLNGEKSIVNDES
ncbi:uncharacterized protein Z519_07659 [Cladophialophora bantiana CBS 173.52]|uniref:Beta-fructofuranosidase n=1 Tax=Cladophialophora bantiana (strain ATCC 10958 / CBS 173.52 / CDC B-1940 / NIH 8579) TaxID=1442370 RepID=A0A0D2ENY1_CLAB1|nr:uncharacterized protein Z519_07659 [Cladophialophora bantiana CBS 173.52]KIW91691.1 hypothetical protein Z519_07659 [Cladophialophora bantiana CBS 173.52]